MLTSKHVTFYTQSDFDAKLIYTLSMTIAMHNLCFKIVRGWREAKVKDLMEQHPMLFCTVFNSWEQRLAVQMRLGFRKKKEQTLYWVLNELLTNIHLSITCLVPRCLLEKLDFWSECLGTRLEHYSVAVVC